MKKIIGLIVLIIVCVGGYWFYKKSGWSIPNDPAKAYDKVVSLPSSEQEKGFQKTLASWIHDPSTIIPYPKGWRKTSVTIGKDTFDVITSDQNNPPMYYVSTSFPKKLKKQVTIIRCLNLDAKKITDWCIVGDNAQATAYFKIIELVKQNALSGGVNLLENVAPKMDFSATTTP